MTDKKEPPTVIINPVCPSCHQRRVTYKGEECNYCRWERQCEDMETKLREWKYE